MWCAHVVSGFAFCSKWLNYIVSMDDIRWKDATEIANNFCIYRGFYLTSGGCIAAKHFPDADLRNTAENCKGKPNPIYRGLYM